MKKIAVLALACILNSLTVSAETSDAPKSPAATTAIKKHDHDTQIAQQTYETARQIYLKSLIKIDQQEINDLTKAQKVAISNGPAGFEEAKRIEQSVKTTQEQLKSHQEQLNTPQENSGPNAVTWKTQGNPISTNGQLTFTNGSQTAQTNNLHLPIKLTTKIYLKDAENYMIKINLLNNYKLRIQQGQGNNTLALIENAQGTLIQRIDMPPTQKEHTITIGINQDKTTQLTIDNKPIPTPPYNDSFPTEGPIIIGGNPITYKTLTIE